jgi:hypothetical protein
MPMDSRAAEGISIIRTFSGRERGDHPAAFSEHLDELLGDAFVFEARRKEVPAEPGAATWEEALEQSAQLRAVAATLPANKVGDLRAQVEGYIADWSNRPASYIIVVGSRRTTR